MNQIDTILADKHFLPEDGIVIFADARSGSTWLMELLGHIPGSIINWEPLHKERGVVPVNFNWGDRPYIPLDDTHEAYQDCIRDILSLRKYSDWTIGKNSPEGLVKGKIVLTKFVRANLLIPWMCQQVKFKHKPLLLMRHPIDTCLSQLRAFGSRTNDYGEIPSGINNARFTHHRKMMKQAQNDLEYKIVLWCINNMPILENPCLGDWVEVVYYEDLIIDPRKQLRSILGRIIPYVHIPEVMSLIPLRAPSETNLHGGLENSPVKQLYKNIDAIGYSQKERIQIIFDHFGLKLYDAFGPYRTCSKLSL
ncbi:sulfotransferase [Echinicola soli]|uniref:Sulfotransferase n=1 Tax=Echinicola soli TaxID=2591634 RepID=A0A514CGT1_9BACT|nr:sulfotransferase [Echinicola soli]QDH79018.1 sulfotransferase [Echinicola soli]